MLESLKLAEMLKIACRVKQWEYEDHDAFTSVDSEVRIRITREKESLGHYECAITAELKGLRIGSAKERRTAGPLHEILGRLTFAQNQNGNHGDPWEDEQRRTTAEQVRRSLR